VNFQRITNFGFFNNLKVENHQLWFFEKKTKIKEPFSLLFQKSLKTYNFHEKTSQFLADFFDIFQFFGEL
jgi:hypothetical protein